MVAGDPDKFPALLVREQRGSRRSNAGPSQIPALIPYVTGGEFQQATAEMHLPQNSCNAALQSWLSGTQSPNLLPPPNSRHCQSQVSPDLSLCQRRHHNHCYHQQDLLKDSLALMLSYKGICTSESEVQTPKKLVVLAITEIRVLTSILDNRQIQPFHMSHVTCSFEAAMTSRY